MPPIISIVGRSNSGKTTMLEKLIAVLRERGIKVAVIKHTRNDLELDQKGKDSWRFSQAGSEVSAIVSSDKMAIFKKLQEDPDPKDILGYFADGCDLILTEGFKRNDYLKIEVHRKEQGSELVSPRQQLLGIVTDEPLDIDVPQFAFDEILKIADLIESTLTTMTAEDDIDVYIDNNCVPINQSTKNLLSQTLAAVTYGLKGTKNMKKLRVSLRRKA